MSNVLIIGATRGLGLEFARQYVDAGDRVWATARDAAGRERLQALGVENVLTVDVADPASISGLAWMLDGEKIDTALYVAGVASSIADGLVRARAALASGAASAKLDQLVARTHALAAA